MFDKIIIINWKFCDEFNDKFFLCEKNNQLICKNLTKVADMKSVADEQKKITKELLILLHANHPHSNINKKNLKIDPNSTVIKIQKFGGGSEPVYATSKFSGLLGTGRDLDSESYYKDHKGNIRIKKENFFFVWNYYWNKLDREHQKNKILNLWLPLALDIQGLSEVYQQSIKEENGEDWKNKLNEYWGEIKKSGPFLRLWKKHNDIAGDCQELKLDKSKENKLKTFLEKLDSTIIKKIPEEKYVDPKSDFFFPNWLEKYTKRIQ